MTRRRLIVAIVAAVLCGMAWWLPLDRLSAEERLLVGTWSFEGQSGRRGPRFELRQTGNAPAPLRQRRSPPSSRELSTRSAIALR
jgi:hypothetical protein